MAAYFVDIDGTVVYYGTNEPLPGALEKLRALKSMGHQIIFTTKRTTASDFRKLLKEYGLEQEIIMTGVDSPRIVINDHGAQAINHPTDAPWE
jgi:hydroxymethylpyrimidine pyrophosphatase-like HAD family hydrolase